MQFLQTIMELCLLTTQAFCFCCIFISTINSCYWYLIIQVKEDAIPRITIRLATGSLSSLEERWFALLWEGSSLILLNGSMQVVALQSNVALLWNAIVSSTSVMFCTPFVLISWLYTTVVLNSLVLHTLLICECLLITVSRFAVPIVFIFFYFFIDDYVISNLKYVVSEHIVLSCKWQIC